MKIRKNGKTISLSESDMKRIVNKLLKEESDPKEDLVKCCKDAGIKAPMSCISGDFAKCIKEVGEMILTDPVGEGMKAITALNCLKDKQNSSVQH
jgi:hypothetical protein